MTKEQAVDFLMRYFEVEDDEHGREDYQLRVISVEEQEDAFVFECWPYDGARLLDLSVMDRHDLPDTLPESARKQLFAPVFFVYKNNGEAGIPPI